MLHDKIYNDAVGLVRSCGTRDPFKLCRAAGVEVAQMELGGLKGMYTHILGRRYAVINSSLDERTKRIVCAHELGHDRLHRPLAGDFRLREFVLYKMNERPEYEANIFASHILLDDEEVYEYARAGYDAAQLAAVMNTDINLMLIKLSEMSANGDLRVLSLPKADFLKK